MTDATGSGSGSGGKPGNFWSRRSRLGKVLIVVVAVIVGVSVIAALVPSEEEEATSREGTVAETVVEATEMETPETETAPLTTAEESGRVAGKVAGRFARDCFGCGDLKRYIKATNVWCGWRGDTVLVHVRMTNDSIEHVTVNWHPSYTFVGGGEHGAGLSSLQDDGFDSGETRELISEQHPEGVPPGSRIDECKPSFFLIESG